MGGETQPPMGGASAAPAPADPMAGGDMGGDPMTGGDMGGDPMADDPMAGGDMANDPMANDPMAGGDMGGDPMAGGEGDDSTMSIINQLSPEDKEAVRAYAESMLSNSNNNDAAPMGGEEPVMESVIFTKKQLRTIMEGIGVTDDESVVSDRGLNKKKDKSVSKKSPFNSPRFK